MQQVYQTGPWLNDSGTFKIAKSSFVPQGSFGQTACGLRLLCRGRRKKRPGLNRSEFDLSLIGCLQVTCMDPQRAGLMLGSATTSDSLNALEERKVPEGS